ncbi:MAG: FlgD immunoglobulin-like domain containing protein, partial [bacterium]
GEDEDGTGFRKDLIVDGTADLVDTEGPEINFIINGREVMDFALLSPSDILNMNIEDDKSGINITGDVGHKIFAVANDNTQSARDITHFFEYEENSFLRGSLQLPISLFTEFQEVDPANSLNSLSIKAWDNANNSAVKTLQFELVSGDELVLKDVLNYPNPFIENTTFQFLLSQDAEIKIKIYTLAGRLIAELDPIPGEFGLNLVDWDGRDQDGDRLANGVYLYLLKARSEDMATEHLGKMIRMK